MYLQHTCEDTLSTDHDLNEAVDNHKKLGRFEYLNFFLLKDQNNPAYRPGQLCADGSPLGLRAMTWI